MRGFLFEGTPEEVAAAMLAIKSSGEQPTAKNPPLSVVKEEIEGFSSEGNEGPIYVSVDVARRFLSRIPLTPSHVAFFQKLYHSSPDWVDATELQSLIKYTPAQFAGFMGSIGRRATHTNGYVEGSWLFEQEWDYNKNCFKYRLPESVREALKIEKVI